MAFIEFKWPNAVVNDPNISTLCCVKRSILSLVYSYVEGCEKETQWNLRTNARLSDFSITVKASNFGAHGNSEPFSKDYHHQNASYRTKVITVIETVSIGKLALLRSCFVQNSPKEATDLARIGPTFPWGATLTAFTVFVVIVWVTTFKSSLNPRLSSRDQIPRGDDAHLHLWSAERSRHGEETEEVARARPRPRSPGSEEQEATLFRGQRWKCAEEEARNRAVRRKVAAEATRSFAKLETSREGEGASSVVASNRKHWTISEGCRTMNCCCEGSRFFVRPCCKKFEPFLYF